MGLGDEFSFILDSEPKEEEIQRFLSNHSCILKAYCRHSSVGQWRFLSKANLYSHATDFAIGIFGNTTYRWNWTLIEIERPQYKLFTQKGDPTAELTHALRQIADWRAWIQNNLHFARTILPDIVPLCSAVVFIGRRARVAPQDRDLLQMLQLQSSGTSISTFDALLDICRSLDGGSK